MIQTIAHDGTRSSLGMHYTSRPNIMKVLQPLFLDQLQQAYEKTKDSEPQLRVLLTRLSRIRVFDPACGSGNFLIISYKELRKLEIELLRRLGAISQNAPLQYSNISLHNFYGIDLVDFACEVAKLSLWIAEHQMNTAFTGVFGQSRPTLPLGKITTVHQGNALRLDWLEICPLNSNTETYICGNPPYVGSSKQTDEQKQDVDMLLGPRLNGYRILDYVACWLVKTSDYIPVSPRTVSAFVTTSSLCQGEQVPALWPHIFSKDICIRFAHTSFQWSNSAANNAGIICVIVGLGKTSPESKRLVTTTHESLVSNINAYLVPSRNNVVVIKPETPINGLPVATKGSQPSGRELIMSPSEKATLIKSYPGAAKYIKPFRSGEDFLHSLERYALWIEDSELTEARSIPPIAARIDRLKKIRKNGGVNARRTANSSHRFSLITYQNESYLGIPETSSERRHWLQLGLLPAGIVAGNTLYAVYSPPAYLLALLSSRLHRLWTATVSGKLKNDIRYSPSLAYNTFPVPKLSDEQKRILAEHSKTIIKARGRYPGKTIAQLYNPETMPDTIRGAHEASDDYIEQYIYGRRFTDDTHRLQHLFDMYGRLRQIIDHESTLFETNNEVVSK
jgi:hypothetical protein